MELYDNDGEKIDSDVFPDEYGDDLYEYFEDLIEEEVISKTKVFATEEEAKSWVETLVKEFTDKGYEVMNSGYSVYKDKFEAWIEVLESIYAETTSDLG